MTTDPDGGTTVSDGVELDTELLTSFTMVNVSLANDEEVIQALKRRVAEVENHNEVDLVVALSGDESFLRVKGANREAIGSILREMGLQDC